MTEKLSQENSKSGQCVRGKLNDAWYGPMKVGEVNYEVVIPNVKGKKKEIGPFKIVRSGINPRQWF